MLSLFAFQQSMDVILECFWDLNLNGFPKTIGGEEFLIVPYLSNFSADLMEAWDAACRPKNGTFCHLKLCMTRDDYNRSDVRNSVVMCVCLSYVIPYFDDVNCVRYMLTNC